LKVTGAGCAAAAAGAAAGAGAAKTGVAVDTTTAPKSEVAITLLIMFFIMIFVPMAQLLRGSSCALDWRSNDFLTVGSVHLSRRTWLARMAHVAIFYRPGNLAIVTGTTKLTVNNFGHVDFIATRLELEAKIGVAYLASKAHAVEPVRKNDGAHAGFFSIVVNDDITIFRPRFGNTGEQQPPNTYYCIQYKNCSQS